MKNKLTIAILSLALFSTNSAFADSYPPVSNVFGWDQIDLQYARDNNVLGSGWSIAIMDSGIQTDHPYLNGALVDGACFVPDGSCPNGLKEQYGLPAGQTYKNDDGSWGINSWHGTQVAGLALGRPNSQATGGVAPKANLISINNYGGKTNDSDANSILSTLKYVYSIRNKYKIAALSMSYGTIGNQSRDLTGECPNQNPEVTDMVKKLDDAGIAVVVAAGNDWQLSRVNYPACVPNVISVGSVDQFNSLMYWSNSGDRLDVAAPNGVLTSTTINGYTVMNGTSASAPIVAGIITLIREKYPNLKVSQIEYALKESGKKTDDTFRKNIPIVNVRSVFEYLKNNPNPPFDERNYSKLTIAKPAAIDVVSKISWVCIRNKRVLRFNGEKIVCPIGYKLRK